MFGRLSLCMMLSLVLSACASYEPTTRSVSAPSRAASFSAEQDGLSAFAAVVSYKGQQENYFDADLSTAGVMAVQVMAENQTDNTVSVDPDDIQLELPDGRVLTPIDPFSVASMIEEEGSVVGSTIAFGILGYMAAVEAEANAKAQRAMDYENKSFKETTLYGGQAHHGFIFFNQPPSALERAEGNLNVYFRDVATSQAQVVSVPLSGGVTQVAEATSSQEGSTSRLAPAHEADTGRNQPVETSRRAEGAAIFVPNLPPIHPIEELQGYIKSNGERLRRALFEYAREKRLISSGRRYGQFRLHSSSVLDLGGDQAVLQVVYSSKTTWNPDWFKRQILVQWVGGDLVIVQHA